LYDLIEVFYKDIMKIITKEFIVSSKGNCDIIDITSDVRNILTGTKLSEGSCLIFSIGSTAAITTIEYEPGLLKDFPKLMEKLIPQYQSYHHNDTWGDGNGHSHLRSAMVGTSFTVPFLNGELLLGTWQQIVLIDFDNRNRKRRVAVQVAGI
jgi:secondary thiamine-phosphate synthase enzyme